MSNHEAKREAARHDNGQFGEQPHPENPDLALAPPAGLEALGGTEGRLAEALRSAGLTGSLRPYDGTNPDIPDGVPIYSDGQGRELVITETEEWITVVTDDLDPETRLFHRTPQPGNPADAVRAGLWHMAQQGAAWEAFRSGHVYEVRDASIDFNTDGTLYATLDLCNDDGDTTTVTHDYGIGENSLADDYGVLEGIAEDLEAEAVVIDLCEEPEDGDYDTALTKAFRSFLAAAAGDPHARPDIRATAARLQAKWDSSAPAISPEEARKVRDKLHRVFIKDGYRLSTVAGRAEVDSSTAWYSAWIQVHPDGTIDRFVNGQPVAEFDHTRRKAGWMEAIAMKNLEQLRTVAAASERGVL